MNSGLDAEGVSHSAQLPLGGQIWHGLLRTVASERLETRREWIKTMLAFGSPCTQLSDLRLVGAMALPIELQSPPHHEWAVPHPTPRRLLLLWHVSLPLV